MIKKALIIMLFLMCISTLLYAEPLCTCGSSPDWQVVIDCGNNTHQIAGLIDQQEAIRVLCVADKQTVYDNCFLICLFGPQEEFDACLALCYNSFMSSKYDCDLKLYNYIEAIVDDWKICTEAACQ